MGEPHVIKVPKEMTRQAVLDLIAELREAQKDDGHTHYIDMSEVTRMDSSSLGLIVHMWRSMDTNSNSIVFYRPSDVVLSLFKDTNLHRIFRVVDKLPNHDRAQPEGLRGDDPGRQI
jgi:anti-anti-sigma factor